MKKIRFANMLVMDGSQDDFADRDSFVVGSTGSVLVAMPGRRLLSVLVSYHRRHCSAQPLSSMSKLFCISAKLD